MTENEIGKICVDIAIGMHRELGPGFIFNFGEALMKDGIVRAVNGLEEDHNYIHEIHLTQRYPAIDKKQPNI